MRNRVVKQILWAAWLLVGATPCWAFTANKVWMEFRPNGRYRVYVSCTVPELKEFREATVEFSKKKDAEKYYFDLVRGVDFYLPDAKDRDYPKPPTNPEPW
jgi:hypothetical protein